MTAPSRLAGWLRPRAARLTVGTLGACIVGCLVLVNGHWHVQLAARVGVPSGLVWTLTLALDAVGLLGAEVSRQAGTSRGTLGTRVYARLVTGLAVLLSVSAAGVEVLIERGVLVVTPWLAVAVVAVYGLMVAVAAHLVLLLPRRPEPVADELGDAEEGTGDEDDLSPAEVDEDPGPEGEEDAAPDDLAARRDQARRDRERDKKRRQRARRKGPTRPAGDGQRDAGTRRVGTRE